MPTLYPDGRRAIRALLDDHPIAYYPALAAIAGGVTAGVFLAQLVYWHDKGADPDGWIYKTQAAWQSETGLTRREQETARRKLRQRGILEEKLAGIPARLHYRLHVARVIDLLARRHQAGSAQSAPDDSGNPPDKHARKRRTSLAESAKQEWRNPPNKVARKRHASLAQSAKHAETTREHSRDRGSEKTSAAGSPDSVLCSVHGQPMKRRRKDGDTWYSHRLPDGSWCKGAPGDQPSGEPDTQSRAYRREYASQFGIDFSRDAPAEADPEPANPTAPRTTSHPPPAVPAAASTTLGEPCSLPGPRVQPPCPASRRACAAGCGAPGATSGIPPPAHYRGNDFSRS